MIVSAAHLICALLLSAFLSVDAAAPGSSKCAPEEIPNMTIDISNAVTKGARFTDPLKAASIEECVSACCSKLNSIGDRTCNLAVYDTRSSHPVQNCYLFFCPELGSCPMTPSPEVLSFSFWTEKEKNNPYSTKEELKVIPKSKSTGKVQNTSGKKSSPAFHEIVSGESEIKEVLSQHDSVKQSFPSDVHSQTKISEIKPFTKENNADTPDRITSKLLHLANDIDKQLKKIEASSNEAKFSEPVKLSVSPTDKIPLVEPMTISRNKDSKKHSSDFKDTKSTDTKDTKSSKVKKIPEITEAHYPTPALITFAPFVRTLSAAHHPIPNTKKTIIPSPAPSKESKVTKKASSSSTKRTTVLLSHSSTNTSSTATTMKNTQAGSLFITTLVPTTSAVHQAKIVLPTTSVIHQAKTVLPSTSAVHQSKTVLTVTQHNSLRTSLLKAAKSTLNDGDQPSTSKNKQETDRSVPKLTSLEQQAPPYPPGDTKDAARNLDTIPLDSDKSGLVAALVFGVMFLVLVIGLVSHKVSEARRRHQYTKLDYLINGMYVDT